MTRNLTIEEVRMLAATERQMDAGEVAFVIWRGNRLIVQPLVMDELGLQSGQTVSDLIAKAVMEAHLAAAKAALAAHPES